MKHIGWIGLGVMGLPMAVNAAQSGLGLRVWNRTQEKAGPVLEAGAEQAESPAGLLAWADTVVLMLSGPEGIEGVLGPIFQTQPEILNGKVLVNMGTNPPAFSRDLKARLDRQGAVFVDAPVSGTRVQAEDGELVIMASGPDEVLEALAPLFQAVGHRVIPCGEVPKSTLMKLAVNIVLSASIAGLVEGAHFARKSGLDWNTFFQILLAGPLGNDMFAIKARKIMEGDFSPQASIGTVREMLKHITDAAYDIHASIPGTRSNVNLITTAMNRGLADEDACAILKVFDS
jgi:3-hydroxyisobutyrate dehydrogenase